jgi:two-component system, OmpR family, response regulator MprA
MPQHERILVADDELETRRIIVELLTQKGYRVLEAADGRAALKLAQEEKPALALLDIEMPGMGGLEVIARLRELGLAIPVLVLSGRREVEDRVKGLTIGADDYLGKPYDYTELLARVQALLRRHEPAAAAAAGLKIGGLAIDLKLMEARGAAGPIKLSRTECAILELLARHRGEPVTRERMLDVVWGYTYLPETRTLDTHIWRLRKKLGDDGKEPRWIKSVTSAGYLLAAEEA